MGSNPLGSNLMVIQYILVLNCGSQTVLDRPGTVALLAVCRSDDDRSHSPYVPWSSIIFLAN
jgi:hypothetical protein